MGLFDVDDLAEYHCDLSYDKGYKDGYAAAQAEKHGKWIPSDKGDCTYTCSECGFVRDAYLLDEKAYCPKCGARMDGGENGRNYA